MRFRDQNRVPATPKSYRYIFNGEEYRVAWPPTVPWHSFYNTVKTFQERNGHTVSSVEAVEDYICRQIPSGWCVGNDVYRPPAPARKPCGTCGRRK